MPAKNTTYLSGKRKQILSTDLYKRYIEKTDSTIDYKTFREVIIQSNQEIVNCILDDISGFKLPENLGYICIIKYKTQKIPTDYKNSRDLKTFIPLTNLHSFGNVVHIKWFQVNNSKLNVLFPYKFDFLRIFKRRLAKLMKEGKQYQYFSNSDFWSKGRISRRYYKHYKED